MQKKNNRAKPCVIRAEFKSVGALGPKLIGPVVKMT